MAERRLPQTALSSLHRAALNGHTNESIRRRADEVLDEGLGILPAQYARYVTALAAPADIQRGAAVFRDKCATCHQSHGIGANVGPDLNAEFRRSPATIVQDVLSPSAKIASGYQAYAVQLSNGQVHTGILDFESAGRIELRQADGKRQSIARSDIESMTGLSTSLMPDDLASTVTPTDLAHLIAWLRRPPTRRLLFDDDPMFVTQLVDGDGQATVETRDRFAGAISIRVSPLQRHAARIEGWAFPIREHPNVGEYRYLRYAWKAAGADGVMIELSNDGRWPDPSDRRFRFFAGRNSTDWQATEVSANLPTDWTVVTLDLWAEHGDALLTGLAPTAMGGDALFDRIELLRELD